MRRITVGLPVRNGALFLDRALKSLRAQSLDDFTLIVSDNGSTDASVAIARRHASMDDRVKVLSGERGEAATNFQYVLEQCSTEYFMWAAHDDLWDRNFIRSAISALEEGHNYFTANWFVGNLGRNRGVRNARHPLRFLEGSESLERTVSFLNLHHLSYKCNLVYAVYRSDFLESVHHPGAIANDGLFAAQVANASPGYVTDSVLFFKEDRFAGRSRAYQRIRKQLSRTRFMNSNDQGQSFKVARARALVETTAAFPSIPNTLLRIFEAYEEFPRDESSFIVKEQTSLLALARKEIRGNHQLSVNELW